MKDELKIEDIKKVKPPLFVKEANAVGPDIHFTTEELGWDEKDNIYVNPDLTLTLKLMSESPKTDNTFKYYNEIPHKPHSFDKDNPWKMVARSSHIKDLKIYDEPKHFRDLIKHIFNIN